MKKECYKKGLSCDEQFGIIIYYDVNGNKINSCMRHKPTGWSREWKGKKE